MDAAKIVSKISKEHGIIKNVYFLACGGSLVDLYPGYYLSLIHISGVQQYEIWLRKFCSDHDRNHLYGSWNVIP